MVDFCLSRTSGLLDRPSRTLGQVGVNHTKNVSTIDRILRNWWTGVLPFEPLSRGSSHWVGARGSSHGSHTRSHTPNRGVVEADDALPPFLPSQQFLRLSGIACRDREPGATVHLCAQATVHPLRSPFDAMSQDSNRGMANTSNEIVSECRPNSASSISMNKKLVTNTRSGKRPSRISSLLS